MLFSVLRNLCLPWGCENILLLLKQVVIATFKIENNKDSLQADKEACF